MVTAEDFVKKWMEAIKTGRNQSWVAKEMGITRQLAAHRATVLRKRGVKLPKFQTGYQVRKEQIEGLNQLIEELDT